MDRTRALIERSDVERRGHRGPRRSACERPDLCDAQADQLGISRPYALRFNERPPFPTGLTAPFPRVYGA